MVFIMHPQIYPGLFVDCNPEAEHGCKEQKSNVSNMQWRLGIQNGGRIKHNEIYDGNMVLLKLLNAWLHVLEAFMKSEECDPAQQRHLCE